eukprot:6425975-Pyramimonas_sp.AAC.1
MLRVDTSMISVRSIETLATVGLLLVIGGALITVVTAGTWRGCVISSAWCSGPGALQLPMESFRRAFVALVGGSSLAAQLFVIHSCARKEHSQKTLAFRCVSTASLFSIGMCLFVPMSCGALENNRWVYLGVNDVIHDACLVTGLVLFAASCATRPPEWQIPSVYMKVYLGCAIPMIAMINGCPSYPAPLRIMVLLLEIGALGCGHLVLLVLCREMRRVETQPQRLTNEQRSKNPQRSSAQR